MIEIVSTRLNRLIAQQGLNPSSDSSVLFRGRYARHAWVTQLLSVLSKIEVENARRFKFIKDSLMFIAGRNLVRYALSSRQPACAPYQWNIEIDAYGKPYVATESNLHFSITHSWPYASVIIDDFFCCGIDIENHNHKLPWREIAEASFHDQEIDALRSTTSPNHLFWPLWTLKEAVVKALGYGMSYPFDSFHIGIGLNRAWAKDKPLPFSLRHEGTFFKNASLGIAYRKPGQDKQVCQVSDVDIKTMTESGSIYAGVISGKEILL